jgi:hypothetical protein
MNAQSKIARGKSVHLSYAAVIAAFTALMILCQFKVVYARESRAEMVRSVLQVLNSASASGSMEIRGKCELRNLAEIPNTLQAGSSRKNVVETLQPMFANDPAMQITQDQDGTIRMKESGVSDDILKVKIRDFRFDGDSPNGGVYAPNVAVLRVMVTPEVLSFKRLKKIEWVSPAYVAPSNMGPPSPELPHISGSMRNVAVSEILDRVLQTFPGMWLYEDCPAHGDQKRAVYFRFFTFRGHGK